MFPALIRIRRQLFVVEMSAIMASRCRAPLYVLLKITLLENYWPNARWICRTQFSPSALPGGLLIILNRCRPPSIFSRRKRRGAWWRVYGVWPKTMYWRGIVTVAKWIRNAHYLGIGKELSLSTRCISVDALLWWGFVASEEWYWGAHYFFWLLYG